jgi:hypothetical protein
MTPFELSWFGGSVARHFRRRAGDARDLEWGTFSSKDYPPGLVEYARLSWTHGALSEYRSAAAFVEVQRALLAVAAPIDLVGMAGGFVLDELLHVELNARMAMALGGGVSLDVDFTSLVPTPAPELTPLQRCSELVVRTCCVGEAFSVPVLASTVRVTRHPLVADVLRRIVADEAPHARLGWLYLDWIAHELDVRERERLAAVATETLEALSHYWSDIALTSDDGGVSCGRFLVADIEALGWLEAGAYKAVARRAVLEEIVEPLRRRGITIDHDVVHQILP